MRVLPVVYQTDHLLAGGWRAGGWRGEWRHVYSPIKSSGSAFETRQKKMKRKHSVDGGRERERRGGGREG